MQQGSEERERGGAEGSVLLGGAERGEGGVDRSVLIGSAEEGMEHAEGGWIMVVQRGGATPHARNRRDCGTGCTR